MHNIRKILAENLRSLRRSKRGQDGRCWSIADMSRYSGVSTGAIQKIEAGATWPDWSTLEKLAGVLQTSVDELFAISSDMPVQQALEQINRLLGPNSQLEITLRQQPEVPSLEELRVKFDSDYLSSRVSHLLPDVQEALNNSRQQKILDRVLDEINNGSEK